MSTNLSCLPATDYAKQIKKIVSQIYVREQDIYFQGFPNPATELVKKELMKIGIESQDIFTLLSNYIYRFHYVNPKEAETLNQRNSTATDAPIEELLYCDIDKKRKHYHQDRYWQYAHGLFNNRANSKLTLRKGSQAAWLRNGAYAEYSTTTDDDLPLITTTAPTHTFSQESYTATYNWLFGSHKLDNDPCGFVRFYFNLRPLKQAGKLLSRAITRYFNLYEIPFTFKFLAYSQDYLNRTDTAVLYLERRYLLPASYLLRDIYFNELAGNLILFENCCLFAKPLLPGLSFGEDPINSDSFGTSRCRALAHILMEDALGEENPEKRFAKVSASLEERGYVISDFYKNPYSDVDYKFFFDIITNDCVPATGPFGPKSNLPIEDEGLLGKPKQEKYLVAAVRIAIKLVKEAIWVQQDSEWHSGWMAYVPDPRNQKNGYKYTFVTSNGEDIENAIGVASFLNDVYKHFDADLFKKTAESVNTKSGIAGPTYPEQEWYDKDILKAWEILSGNLRGSQDEKEKLADLIIEKFLQEGRPLGNGFQTNEPEKRRLFNPTIKFGLAGLGYFFLTVHNPNTTTPGLPAA